MLFYLGIGFLAVSVAIFIIVFLKLRKDKRVEEILKKKNAVTS